MASSTRNQAAVIPSPTARAETQTRSIPTPGPDEILIQNRAFAANPVDWKIQDFSFIIPASAYPTVLGSDAAGVVHSVGSNVTRFKKGDRVTGFAAVIHNSQADHGAAQEWPLLLSDATVKIPDDLTFTQASVFPMGFATAGYGLFQAAAVPRPQSQNQKPGHGQAILVWGGASSVGSMTIQLARNLGFIVFATASPKHHAWIRDLGAEAVFDYSEPNVVQAIASAASERNVRITVAYDAVSDGNTVKQTIAALDAARDGQPAKLVLTQSPSKDISVPEGVEYGETMAFACWMNKSELGAWLFNDYLGACLAQKSIKPVPEVQIVPGGISAVQTMWDMLKKGVSGKKLVVEIDA